MVRSKKVEDKMPFSCGYFGPVYETASEDVRDWDSHSWGKGTITRTRVPPTIVAEITDYLRVTRVDQAEAQLSGGVLTIQSTLDAPTKQYLLEMARGDSR